MLLITYSLLGLYALPLAFILGAYYVSDGFELYSRTIYVADAISGTFFSLFRDTFGSIIMPLVTAYAVSTKDPNKEIPRQTLALFFTFVGLFLVVVLVYGLVKYSETDLQKFNENDENGKLIKDMPKIFFDITLTYAKEILAYIALILGISLKK